MSVVDPRTKEKLLDQTNMAFLIFCFLRVFPLYSQTQFNRNPCSKPILILTMGASPQQNATRFYLRGARNKTHTSTDSNLHRSNGNDIPIENQDSSCIRPTVKSRNATPSLSATTTSSKPFSPKVVYKKCFHSSNATPCGNNPSSEYMIPQEKKCLRFSVSPDEEESGSMQIIMLESEDGIITSDRAKTNRPLSRSSNSSAEKDRDISTSNNQNPNTEVGIITVATGGEKRGSKLGSLFKSGGKKGGGGEQNNDSANNNNAGGEEDNANDNSNNGEDNGKSGDKRDGSPGENNNNPKSTFDPLTYFGAQRTAFAKQSTLPIHRGCESTAPTSYPSWTPASGKGFHVRVGPNYPKNGKKAPSMASLYEVYCVRYFRSPCRTVGGATRIMPLPEMVERCRCGDDDGNDKETDTNGEKQALNGSNSSHPELRGTKIPDVLVVHFMLPYEPPNMFKQKDDGPGGECVYYLRPSQRFLDEVSGKIPITPATRLFCRWCNECQSNLEMRSRFKCMALVKDIDKHNFGLLKSYNGKPVLITESGRVCSGFHGDMRYLEMTANVHYWAFMAKKGFVSLIPKFKNMQMEVGFTIEGRSDNELPECMLGSTVLSYISEDTGPMITPEMQEPVHEHQS
eukprot:CCRYP_020101-RB/>CCRYP_020101-RB protein AED:0.03 eAED:0.03 QI:540/1/1/1/1/1/3/1089/626